MTKSIDSLIEEYIDTRNSLDTARKEWQSTEADYKQRMAEIEGILLAKSAETGVDSFKTQCGTAFKTTKDYVSYADDPGSDDLLHEYVMKTGDFGVFTRHLNKSHVKELIDAGIELNEIGLKYDSEQVIQVRSPTKRKS